MQCWHCGLFVCMFDSFFFVVAVVFYMVSIYFPLQREMIFLVLLLLLLLLIELFQCFVVRMFYFEVCFSLFFSFFCRESSPSSIEVVHPLHRNYLFFLLLFQKGGRREVYRATYLYRPRMLYSHRH